MLADAFTKSMWSEQLELFVNTGWLNFYTSDDEKYIRASVVNTKNVLCERDVEKMEDTPDTQETIDIREASTCEWLATLD